MTKYTCNNGYSNFSVRADSLTDLRRMLIPKLAVINGKAMFTVYQGTVKKGVLIWDLNGTGQVYWFLDAEDTVNIWGMKTKKPFRSYVVNIDGTLCDKRTYKR